jgi:hypothetical protein
MMKSYGFKVGLATLAVASLLAASALAAYQPDRTTYKWPQTSKAISFNSVTGNPAVGDERSFLIARSFANNNYQDQLSVSDNEEVVLRVYYHNDAPTGQVAKGVKVRFALPAHTSSSAQVSAYISADNANPKVVSDTTNLLAGQNFSLEYEPGSAQIWNNALRGKSLNDSIVTSGALIGYKTADGQINGGPGYSGYVTIKARVHYQKPAPTAGPTNGNVPNTGPGSVIALFFGVSLIAALGHRLTRGSNLE